VEAQPAPSHSEGIPLADERKPPERVEIFLSRKAAATWPGAVVIETNAGFVLRRRGRPEVLLADTFGGAKQALALLRKNEAPGAE
jgi:hypothetical protein